MSYSQSASQSQSSSGASSASSFSAGRRAVYASKPDSRSVHSRDGDSFYVEDNRQIKQNIELLQAHTATISKMCRSVDAEGWKSAEYTKTIHEEMARAKAVAVSTQMLLRNFGSITGGTAAEISQRRLMHDKLLANFQLTLKSLERAAQDQIQLAETSGTRASRNANSSSYPAPLALSHRHSPADESLSTNTSAYCSSNANSIWSTDSLLDTPSSAPSPSVTPVPSSSLIGFNKAQRLPLGSSNREPHSGVTSVTSSRLISSPTYLPPYAALTESTYIAPGALSGSVSHVAAQKTKYLVPIVVNSGELEEEIMKERQEGIKQIEADIKGIHDLYQELAFHVGNQGNDLDNIESQMRQAASHTSNATAEVASAHVYQRSRTRTICLLVTGIIIGLFVILSVLNRILHLGWL